MCEENRSILLKFKDAQEELEQLKQKLSNFTFPMQITYITSLPVLHHIKFSLDIFLTLTWTQISMTLSTMWHHAFLSWAFS